MSSRFIAQIRMAAAKYASLAGRGWLCWTHPRFREEPVVTKEQVAYEILSGVGCLCHLRSKYLEDEPEAAEYFDFLSAEQRLDLAQAACAGIRRGPLRVVEVSLEGRLIRGMDDAATDYGLVSRTMLWCHEVEAAFDLACALGGKQLEYCIEWSSATMYFQEAVEALAYRPHLAAEASRQLVPIRKFQDPKVAEPTEWFAQFRALDTEPKESMETTSEAVSSLWRCLPDLRRLLS